MYIHTYILYPYIVIYRVCIYNQFASSVFSPFFFLLSTLQSNKAKRAIPLIYFFL